MPNEIKIGYISASDPEELDYDFGDLLPRGVRMIGVAPAEPIREVTLDAIDAAERGVEDAADRLAGLGVDAVLVSIAPLIYVRGSGYDRLLIERIHARTGLPATTNQTAAVEALRFLGIDSVLLLNPNTADLVEKQAEFFERSRVHVVAAKCMNIRDNRDIDRVDEATSYRFIKESIEGSPSADGLYLSGPCWRTLGLIESLERETDLPVVTALQGMVWAGLRMAGVAPNVDGCGRLMRTEDVVDRSG
jgi:maleate isomerase